MFNINDLMSGGIMKKLKGMQENVAKFQNDLSQLEVTGTTGAAEITVVVTINGNAKITDINISNAAFNEGKEIVSDLLMGALNDANEKIIEAKRNKLKELGLPSGIEQLGDLFR